MNRSNKALGLALVLSFVAVACAAPAIPQSDDVSGDDAAQTTTKKPSPKKPTPSPAGSTDPDGAAPSPTPDPSSPTPTPTPADCSSSASYDACFQCCDAQAGGTLGPADNAFGACACDAGGQCASACGQNFCNGQQPSAACEACLTSTCEPAADALCTGAACKAGVQCLQTSNCDAKP